VLSGTENGRPNSEFRNSTFQNIKISRKFVFYVFYGQIKHGALQYFSLQFVQELKIPVYKSI